MPVFAQDGEVVRDGASGGAAVPRRGAAGCWVIRSASGFVHP